MFKIGSMSSEFGSDPTVRKLSASSIHWEGQNQARSPRGSLKARARFHGPSAPQVATWGHMGPHGPHGATWGHMGPHVHHIMYTI